MHYRVNSADTRVAKFYNSDSTTYQVHKLGQFFLNSLSIKRGNKNSMSHKGFFSELNEIVHATP